LRKNVGCERYRQWIFSRVYSSKSTFRHSFTSEGSGLLLITSAKAVRIFPVWWEGYSHYQFWDLGNSILPSHCVLDSLLCFACCATLQHSQHVVESKSQ
jgi:hypothetical protein